MSSDKKFRKDREVLLELEGNVKDIRNQLSDQLKCLDQRLDAHSSMLGELQDFYHKRAEIEMEYSRSLDRLVKNVMLRHKQERQKREVWPYYSTYSCWQSLLTSTKRESKDHAILGELYQNQVCNRYADIMDDMQRVYRKCREIGAENHEELLKQLNELQTAMKTYQQYHGEAKQAENKLRYVESQKQKVVDSSKQGSQSRKAKNMEKQADKKQLKYTENKRKALVARNEYILALDTANAAVQRYYWEDLHNLINCIDCGYHMSVQRVFMIHASAEECLVRSREDCMKRLNGCVSELDQRADKQRFLELHNSAFSLPKKFEFQSHKGDEICQLSAQKSVQDELLDRLKSLEKRINELKLQNDEDWKSIETVERSFIEMINQKDYDVSSMFSEEVRPPKSPHEHYKKRSDRMDTEGYYIQKFRRFSLESNLIARLQSKYNSIQKALGEGGHTVGTPRPPSLPPKPKASRRLGKIPKEGQPKLFMGSIEEYVEATEQEIPIVVRSCIRVINLYGRHHQGVFRVSGSQHEINEFKNSFEKGEDPLVDVVGSKDINSVAGVLKLYFRELKEPLFPTQLFDELINCSRLESHVDFITRVRELVLALPRTIFVVMRYLFMFLSHLSEYADENMMDPYNLAICFGPTLLPIPPDRDQVQFQNYVIEMVKNVIIYQEQIFPRDIEGPLYEKIVLEEDGDTQDSLDNLSDEDLDEIADNISEDEPDLFEAVAQFDFQGRTEREISFRKGDLMEVFDRVSPDWWKGAYRGKSGLIPDKYVSVRPLRHRHEEKSASTSEIPRDEKRKSAESLPARPCNLTESGSRGDISASQPNVSMKPDSSKPVYPTAASGPHSPGDFTEVSSFVRGLGTGTPRGSNKSLSSTHSKESIGNNSVVGVDGGSTMPASSLVSQSYTPNIKEGAMSVKGVTTTSSLSDHLSDSIISTDSGTDSLSSSKDRSYSSSSRDTLASKDSGYSHNGSRDATPVKDTGSNRGSRDKLDETSSSTVTMSSTNRPEEVKAKVEEVEQVVGKQKDGPTGTGGEWTSDLDTTLAEIMHGVESLEKQQQKEEHTTTLVVSSSSTINTTTTTHPTKPESLPPVNNKDTPDLVLGLPVGKDSPSPTPSPKSKDDSPTMSTAEVFANNNQSTIKKGSHVTVPKEEEQQQHHQQQQQVRQPPTIAPTIITTATAKFSPSASTTLPIMSKPPDLSEYAFKRSNTLTAASQARNVRGVTAKDTSKNTMASLTATMPASLPSSAASPEHYRSSDPGDSAGRTPELPTSVQLQKIASVIRSKDQVSPQHLRSVTPERQINSDKPFSYTQSPEGLKAFQRSSPDKVRPPIKSKPSIFKKPGK